MLKQGLIAAALALAATGCKNDKYRPGAMNEKGETDVVAKGTYPVEPSPAPEVTLPGQAAPGAPANVSGAGAAMTAAQVLTQLHAINLHEIDAGKLAQMQGGPVAKSFGTKMVKDHSMAERQVQDAARASQVTLKDMSAMVTDPTLSQAEKDQLKADMEKMASLKAMKGAQFDKGYLTAMSEGHAKALQFLHQAQAQVDDARVKDLVGKLTPVVQGHKDLADQDLQKLSAPTAQGRRP